MTSAAHDQRAIDLLRADAEHWRKMYRACFAAACSSLAEAQRTIATQREQLADLREARERYAERLFNE
jgi:hypothetical protein